MKTFSIALAVAVSATLASAQTPTIINGEKVLLDKYGRVMAPPTIVQLPGAPLVGGSDTCATPDVIVGSGPFAFDTTLATTGTEGQAETICNFAAQIGINRDVWFTWTASFSGPAQLTTCAMATFDTKAAVYDGSACPTAAAIACNDDSCGLQTTLQFTAVSGNAYTIQLGQWGTGTPAPGTFTINAFVPPVPPPNDDCTTPTAITGPGTYPFDTTLATTATQYAATCGNIYKDVWYTYTATATGTATLTTCGGIATPPSTTPDTKVAIYAGAGCPTATSIGCNDDAPCTTQSGLTSTVSWPAVCGTQYAIRLGNFSSGTAVGIAGTFTVTETGASCGTPTTPYCFGTAAACPCGNNGAAGNGCANSVNAAGGNLAGAGVASVAADSFVLTGTGMPSASALYFQGTAQVAGGTGAIFGDGLRCAGGTVIRLGTKTNVAGTSSYPSGTDVPIHTKGAIPAAGGTRDYQCWYRNAAVFCTTSTFNLTNGLEVTWTP